MRVLLVEDNVTNQLLATRLLEKLGCVVETARDGVEAVQAASASRHDLIFMDCHMPRMDGLQATQAIRAAQARGARVPIIALTASVMANERDQCLLAGMDDFLGKPIDVADLRRVLAKWRPRDPDPAMARTDSREEPAARPVDC